MADWREKILKNDKPSQLSIPDSRVGELDEVKSGRNGKLISRACQHSTRQFKWQPPINPSIWFKSRWEDEKKMKIPFGIWPPLQLFFVWVKIGPWVLTRRFWDSEKSDIINVTNMSRLDRVLDRRGHWILSLNWCQFWPKTFRFYLIITNNK